MKILYGYSNCSYRKYNEIFADSSKMILQQAQKYHSLMINGLALNNAEITCISGLPINRSLTKKLYVKSEKEIVDSVKYHYFGTINISVFRRIMLVIKSFFKTLLFTDINSVVICDILNISVVIGMLLGAKPRKIPIIGIVTDVPGHFADSDNKNLTEKINLFFLRKFDAYVLLTDRMNEVANPGKRPYVVIEGHADINMAKIENKIENKSVPKILMYAGSLQKIYGIERLIKAFIQVNNSDWELHIYGDGDYTDELKTLCRKHINIKYKGVKPNYEIVKSEISASLLVNPRPTDEEYVKYSFPSKNMEYMASGTPILTTKLPGMPEEYNKYVYLFEDETAEGMANKLNDVLSKTKEEFHIKGLKARMFVLENKNNVIQAKKIMDMIGTINVKCKNQ